MVMHTNKKARSHLAIFAHSPSVISVEKYAIQKYFLIRYMVRDYILPLFHVSQISRWYRFWNWLIIIWFKFIEEDGKSRQMGVCRYQ